MNPRHLPVPAPVLRDLADRAAGYGLSRRAFLGLLGAVGGAAALGGCANGETVRWANWALYLDTADDNVTHPTLEDFQKETGIKVSYLEDIEDNDTFYGKVHGRLGRGQDIGYDLVTVSDWMVGRWVRQGYAQKMDRSAMPNTKNLLPELENVDYDPGRAYTMPWQSGFTGIAWNKAAVPDGLHSVSDLWQREDLRGRVMALSNIPDTIGLIMLSQGVDPSGPWGDAEFSKALGVVTTNLADGQLRAVKGISYKEDLVSGDALAAIVWSGDIVQLNAESEDKWEFRIPDEGGMLWSDNLLVPSTTDKLESVQKLVNFYYDPVVAATVAAWVAYVTPVNGAREAMKDIDPELVDDPLIFPDEETLANTRVFRTLTPDEEKDYGNRFLAAIGN